MAKKGCKFFEGTAAWSCLLLLSNRRKKFLATTYHPYLPSLNNSQNQGRPSASRCVIWAGSLGLSYRKQIVVADVTGKLPPKTVLGDWIGCCTRNGDTLSNS